MFRTGGSVELGRKTLLYFVLALVFNGKASDATHKEFGCEFENDAYNIRRNSNNDQFKGIWSEEGIDPTSLPPFDPGSIYWNPIKEYLSEATVMNDMAPFVQ
uniref:Uncharacterized protein n=1 Tax=Cacopsylla melanoneura TaxID=428564 RepID=A0A8D8QF61_9HEMI